MQSAQKTNIFLFQHHSLPEYQYLSVQDLTIWKSNLQQNLQQQLKNNKQILVKTLLGNYMQIPSEQSCYSFYDSKQSTKNVENFELQKNTDEIKEFNPAPKLRTLKNKQIYDTKNIPKNFGTAIHIYIKKNSKRVKNLLKKNNVSFHQFSLFIKQAKQKINSLLHLRQLWHSHESENDFKLKECYRVLSFEFMRKHCLGYIFGSRIKNTSSHIRYRRKLLQGIERPYALFNLKDY